MPERKNIKNQGQYRPVQAFRNRDFIEGHDGRSLRIMAEYMEPRSRLAHFNIEDTIVFMGSARTLDRATAEARLAEAKASGGDVARAERHLNMSRYYEDTRELARRFTLWSKALTEHNQRFVVCTGGGPGIMEAANRGASEAGGINLGFNITLPMEQHENPYSTRELTFEFHYFFMRKFWFAYLAKAIIFMPGGFGSLDELAEVLTLAQTNKMNKRLPLVLYGTDYWDSVLNFQAMVDHGTIDAEDLNLFLRSDSVDETFTYVTKHLLEHALKSPGIDL